MTPQTLENDIKTHNFDTSTTTLIVLD